MKAGPGNLHWLCVVWFLDLAMSAPGEREGDQSWGLTRLSLPFRPDLEDRAARMRLQHRRMCLDSLCKTRRQSPPSKLR